MARVFDRVKETTTTTGIGTYTLGGAQTGFRTFASVATNLDSVEYCVSDGTNWEVGQGVFTTAGTTLARTTILASSNAGSAVSWGAGPKDVWSNASAWLVTNISPTFTTSVLTDSTSFDVFNTIATTINAFGAASVALNIGNAAVAAAFPGGISIAASKSITGNVLNSTISGFLSVAATTGTFTNVGGTLSTAAQGNVTSLGTLTGLTVSGAMSNFYVTSALGAARFYGYGSDARDSSGGIILGGNTSFQGKLWYDGSPGALYLDNTYDNAVGAIYLRTRTAGTPVNAASFTATAATLPGTLGVTGAITGGTNSGIGASVSPIFTAANRGNLTINGSADAVLVVTKGNSTSDYGTFYFSGTELNINSSHGLTLNTLNATGAVTMGANDSGGAGYKVLRVPN